MHQQYGRIEMNPGQHLRGRRLPESVLEATGAEAPRAN